MTLKMEMLVIPKSFVNIKLLDWLETHQNWISGIHQEIYASYFINKNLFKCTRPPKLNAAVSY